MKAETAVAPFEFGAPERPRGLARSARNAWNTLVADLSASRKLAKSDGELLLALIQARADAYNSAGQRRIAAKAEVARIEHIWAARPAFAPPTHSAPENTVIKPVMTLEAFIQAVKVERATFDTRRVPGQTIVGEFNAAATIARDYCDAVLGGKIESCELLRRACARHLDDLKHGAERGLFYDAVAAENIRTWFETFCGIPLEPWEVWILTSIFAWKRVTGLRRFREAWLSVARKNGKTAISGGIGLFGLVADQEKYAEVYSAATKRDQAVLAFRAACRMRDAHPELKEYVRKQVSSLFIEDTDCFFQTLSADSRTTDGLNPHIVLADELHEWQGREYWDKLQTALVNRKQPLMVATTTAGNDLESFAATKEEVGEKLLTGIFPNDDLFVAIYRMEPGDSYKDESKWQRSNPNLGVSVQVEALRSQIAEVEEDPTKLNAFLRYHANQWITLRAGASLPMDRIEKCVGPMPEGKELSPLELRNWFLDIFSGEVCLGGFDYGEINDLCCFTLLYPRAVLSGNPQQWIVAVPWFFIPEDGLVQKEKRWRVPLVQWCREGWIQTLPGDIADPMVIKEHLSGIIGNNRPRAIGYDGWGCRTMMSSINDDRLCKTFEVAQQPSVLSVPCKEFKTSVLKGTFAHLNNPVLKWHMQNVRLETGIHTGMRPEKMNKDQNKKIDGVSAIVTAWAISLDAEINKPSWDGKMKFI